MPKAREKKTMQCKLCSYEGYPRPFARHLQLKHKINTREYTARFILNLTDIPVCAQEGCSGEVYYERFKFSKFCKEHAPQRNGGAYTDKEFSSLCETAVQHQKTIKTEYNSYLTETDKRLDIHCNKCGHDWKRAIGHFKRTYSCPKCELKKSVDHGRSNREEFIQKAIELHGDKYDYSEVEYTNTDTKVSILCKKHKETFQQSPHRHLSGQGCKKCGYEKLRANSLDTVEQFIEKAKKRHPDLYEYDMVVYNGCRERVKIYCKSCDQTFWQVPYMHLAGNGCQKCNYKGTSREEDEVYQTVLSILLGDKKHA